MDELSLLYKRDGVIYRGFTNLLDYKEEYTKMVKAVNPYGDGRARERTADILEDKERGSDGLAS